MPAVSDLTSVRAFFASGTAELNAAILERFSQRLPDLPLCVIAEFEPPAGEWIPWHVRRPFNQNLAAVKTALAGRSIADAAVAYDKRSALHDLRKAAHTLVHTNLTLFDETLATAPAERLTSFLARRVLRTLTSQLSEGGRLRLWLRRVAHPAEAEIPVRARIAQARGLAANRVRAVRPQAALSIRANLREGTTIVIPTRDGRELLQEMLPPLVAQLDPATTEIIIVDNGSTDNTGIWLADEYPAIRLSRHAAPLSFAKAVNAGVREAGFARTLLLNNDMLVEPGFVTALQQAFDHVPDLFCASAQILFPPGARREETGKTVWRRVHDLDFPVRCDDPLPSEDLTWVLYGSGGCSLFDTVKLARLGGVDELYDPAYVEDLDFGFRAWKHGWPTVYCAKARVEHRHRSTTARFYSGRQIDFFVERNYLRFVANAVADLPLFERLWLEAIRRLQLQAMAGRGAALDTLRAIPPIGPKVQAADGHLTEEEILALNNGDIAVFSGLPAIAHRTILIASPYLPFPLSHGGAVRMFNLMKCAARANNLILIAFADELATPPEELRVLCTQIVLVRRHGSHYRRDTPRPDTVEEFDSPSFRAALQQAIHQWRPQIAQLEFTWMAQYADACPPARTLLVEHDITFDLQQQLLNATPATNPTLRLELQQQLAKWTSFETAAWRTVDCVVAMSPKDAESVQGARAVECIPNGVDCERFQPSTMEPDPRRLLLVGSFAHLPNLLALEFFLRDVWPLLGPGYTLHVIGGARHDYYLDFFHDRVRVNLNQPGIEIEGFVSDVRDAYHRAAIVLAPLTASAGTNIKVLEAMAMGKPVVSTSIGVNGLDVTPDHDVLLSYSAAEMAAQISALAADAGRRHELGRNARQSALRFDWSAIAERHQRLYDRLAGDIQ